MPRSSRSTYYQTLVMYFQIGASMGDQDKVETLLLLIQNVDVFAWSLYEVLGADPEFIVHRLSLSSAGQF